MQLTTRRKALFLGPAVITAAVLSAAVYFTMTIRGNIPRIIANLERGTIGSREIEAMLWTGVQCIEGLIVGLGVFSFLWYFVGSKMSDRRGRLAAGSQPKGGSPTT